MAKVKVPRTPKSSYNPERRPSALLLDQVKHLEWAALPASQRKPEQLKVYKQVKTEWQAAERIAQLTNLIKAAKEAIPLRDVALGALPPVLLPPLPPTMPKTAAAGSRAETSRGKTRKRKAASRKAASRKSARSRKAASRAAKKAKAKSTRARGTARSSSRGGGGKRR